MVDRVQLTKYETTALGGDDADTLPYPAPIDAQEDAIEAAGLYVQDASNRDENVFLSRSGDDMTFKDVNNSGGLTLSQLVRNVSKVGTPANNELAVWTGDGTLEGESGLTYDGSTLTVSGDVSATDVLATNAELTGAVILTEMAAAGGDTAGKGQIWVKNDTPNDLYFTDDTGVDHLLSLTEADYAKLTGRSGGQTLQGGTEASQDLTLVSTASATRGHIYLGAAQTSAFDETNGRLGINEPAPSYPLHAKSAGDAYGIAHTDGTHTVGTWVGSGAGWFGTISNHWLGIGVNGGTDLAIDASGNVGINTSSPDQTLHVHKGSAGTIDANSKAWLVVEADDHAYINFLSPAGKEQGIIFGEAGDSNLVAGIFYGHSTDYLLFTVAGNTVFNANSSGDVVFPQTTATLGIGGNIDAQSMIHLYAGSAGSVTPLAGTQLTLEDNADAYLSFLTPNTASSGILFGDADDNDVGQIVYDHSANQLSFTDGTTGTKTLAELAAGGGGGDVSVSGTPVDNQVAVWTGSDTIEGTTALTYASNAFQVTNAAPILYAKDTSSGDTALTAAMAGMQLSAVTMDATNKYTPAVKFLSTDASFTTENPKFLAAIVGRATEEYAADTDGGMALDFAVTADDPGTTNVPDVRMSLTSTGLQVAAPPNVWGAALEVGPQNASSGYLDISLNNIAGGLTTYSELWWQFASDYCQWALGAAGPNSDEAGSFWLYHGKDKDATAHNTYVLYVDDDGNIQISADGAGYGSNSYIQFKIDGDEYAKLTTAGLHVTGTAYPTIRAQSTDGEGGTLQLDSTGGYYQLYVDDDGDLNFYDGSNITVTVESGGQVGIGTKTIPHVATGAALLALEGTDSSVLGPHVQFTTPTDNYPLVQMLHWAHDTIALSLDAYYDGTWRSSDVGSNFQVYKNSDKLAIQYDSGITAGTAVTWNPGLVMDTSGQVGINTNAPGSLLHVKGSAFPAVRVESTDSEGGTIRLDSDTDYYEMYMESDSYLGFYNGSSITVTFGLDGDVGIGVTNADSRLHVMEASAGTVAALTNTVLTVENSTNAYLSFLTPNTSSSGIVFGCATDGNNLGSITYNHSTNTLSFTDETTGTKTLAELAAAGSGAQISGTPADSQIAVWTNATTIEGTSTLTFDGSGVGIGETAPLGKLHIKSADVGTIAPDANADELIIEGTSHTGMTIYSGATSLGTIYFGNVNDDVVGALWYDHNNSRMAFYVANGDRVDITSTYMLLNTGVDLYFVNAGTKIEKDGDNLSFTDGITGTKTLAELAAGGVDTSGSPNNTYVATFSDADTITGTAELTWNGTTLHIDNGNSGVTPAVNYDDLFVENSTHAGITIGSGTSYYGHLVFGSTDDIDGGRISYYHPWQDYFILANSVQIMAWESGGRVAVNVDSAYAPLHVRCNATGATEVLYLEQDDTDQPFVNFQGTSGSGTTNSISTYTTPGTVGGFLKIEVNGSTKWLPFYNTISA